MKERKLNQIISKVFKYQILNIKVKAIEIGQNTISLVIEAIKKWENFADDGKYFEHLWCVFDRDEFSQKNYNQAFEKIRSEERKINKKFKEKVGRGVKINIAYSNEAFELWYLLHYNYIDSACDRSQYSAMLSSRMGKTYRKNDPTMYEFLAESLQSADNKGQSFACSNAKKLRAKCTSSLGHNQKPVDHS